MYLLEGGYVPSKGKPALPDGLSAGSKWPPTLPEDSAPSACLDGLQARAAPTHPRAQPEQLEGLPWPQELASSWPKVEECPRAWWLKVESPRLWGGLRRAPEAKVSFQAAQAALWGA